MGIKILCIRNCTEEKIALKYFFRLPTNCALTSVVLTKTRLKMTDKEMHDYNKSCICQICEKEVIRETIATKQAIIEVQVI
jgi:hypothetical protein